MFLLRLGLFVVIATLSHSLLVFTGASLYQDESLVSYFIFVSNGSRQLERKGAWKTVSAVGRCRVGVTGSSPCTCTCMSDTRSQSSDRVPHVLMLRASPFGRLGREGEEAKTI